MTDMANILASKVRIYEYISFGNAHKDPRLWSAHCQLGYRVAQVRAIISLPKRKAASLFRPNRSIPQYLAYVEWFVWMDRAPRDDLSLYRLKRSLDTNGNRLASVIPIQNIRRSVHLYPAFGPAMPAHWTSSNVLDQCSTFYLNPMSDRHAYHTLV